MDLYPLHKKSRRSYMKKLSTPLKRIIIFLILSTMLCSTFSACTKITTEQTPLDTNTDSDKNTDGINKPSNGSTNNSTNDSTDAPTNDTDKTTDSIPIFANGAYVAKIICPDKATDFEKDAYDKIRKLLKSKTGVNPEAATDYVANGEKQYDGPAILIGETNYTESKEVYKKLKNDEAIGTVSGNKYVIAISSADAFDKFITAFKSNLSRKATKAEITINSKWDITAVSEFIVSGNETFDETGLISSASLPNLGTSYNAGQGSKTYIKNSATKSTFETLCKEIEANGWKKYTSNTIGNNLFATYITQTQITHVMFFPNKSQIRTAVDKRGEGMNGFALTGLSGENKYKPTTDSKMILCEISNADWIGGMCLIFKLSDGRFFIVDAGIGGYLSDGRNYKGSSAGWIYATLAKHAQDPKNIEVAAWLITHPHSDHAGGLYDMALGYYGYNGAKHTVMPKEMKQYIKIDKIIYNAPDKFPDADRTGWMKKIIEGFKVKNVVKAHPGQVFYLADLKLTIYGSLDIMLENSSKSSDLNDFSILSRAEFNGKSMLITGDTDSIPNPVIAAIYKESLKSDILQMSHHGYGDVGDHAVNSYCNPEITIWPVSNRDKRTDFNVNVKISMETSLVTLTNLRNKKADKDTATATLSNGKNYLPYGGNMVFDKNWNPTTTPYSETLSAIPKCDGTYCGNKNCSIKSSSEERIKHFMQPKS